MLNAVPCLSLLFPGRSQSPRPLPSQYSVFVLIIPHLTLLGLLMGPQVLWKALPVILPSPTPSNVLQP